MRQVTRQTLEDYKFKIVTSCELCHGVRPECLCMEKFKKIYRFVKGNIQPAYWELTFASIKQQNLLQAKKSLQEYLANLDKNVATGKGFYISGGNSEPGKPSKIGKSTLANIVLKEAVDRGYSVYVTDVDDLNDAYNYQSDYEESHTIRETLESADLVLVDNLGDLASMQTLPPFRKRQITKIHSDRSGIQKPTLFTGNLKPTEITTVFGEPFKTALNFNTTFLSI